MVLSQFHVDVTRPHRHYLGRVVDSRADFISRGSPTDGSARLVGCGGSKVASTRGRRTGSSTRFAAAVQHGPVRVRFCSSGAAALSPFCAGRQGDAGPDDDLQLGDVVLHEHRPAGLRRRTAPLVLQPDRVRRGQHVPLGERRLLCAGGRRARPARRRPHGEFLRRHVADRRLRLLSRQPRDGRAARWPKACP